MRLFIRELTKSCFWFCGRSFVSSPISNLERNYI